MTITLTWDGFFKWLGYLTCGGLTIAALVYLIGFIIFCIGASGWTFRDSWFGRKLRRVPRTPAATPQPVQQEEDPNVEG